MLMARKNRMRKGMEVGISKGGLNNRVRDQSLCWGIMGVKVREVKEGLECHHKYFGPNHQKKQLYSLHQEIK